MSSGGVASRGSISGSVKPTSGGSIKNNRPLQLKAVGIPVRQQYNKASVAASAIKVGGGRPINQDLYEHTK